MILDLHEIIEMPGKSVPFQCELDEERLAFPQLEAFEGPVTARGRVRNEAGVLHLEADVAADMTVRCDRCGKPFRRKLSPRYTAVLQADAEDADSENVFPLDGDGADVSDVAETLLILDMDGKFLCRPDCRGLCPTCGKDLNDGPCDCKKEIDPRMAALGQLLDDIQEV